MCRGKAALFFAMFFWLFLNQAEQERSRRDPPPHSLGAAAFNRPREWFIIPACLGAARGWGELFLTNCRGLRGLAQPLCQVSGVAPPWQSHCHRRSSLLEGEHCDFCSSLCMWLPHLKLSFPHSDHSLLHKVTRQLWVSQPCLPQPGAIQRGCRAKNVQTACLTLPGMLGHKQLCSESILQVHHCSPLKKTPISLLKTWKRKILSCVFQRSS